MRHASCVVAWLDEKLSARNRTWISASSVALVNIPIQPGEAAFPVKIIACAGIVWEVDEAVQQVACAHVLWNVPRPWIDGRGKVMSQASANDLNHRAAPATSLWVVSVQAIVSPPVSPIAQNNADFRGLQTQRTSLKNLIFSNCTGDPGIR